MNKITLASELRKDVAQRLKSIVTDIGNWYKEIDWKDSRNTSTPELIEGAKLLKLKFRLESESWEIGFQK